MKLIVNKPPRSKIISVIKETNEQRFLLKESIKGKWKFFVIENKNDKIARQAIRFNTIAEEIAMRQKLVDAGSVESFLLSNRTYKNTAGNRKLMFKY